MTTTREPTLRERLRDCSKTRHRLEGEVQRLRRHCRQLERELAEARKARAVVVDTLRDVGWL